MTSSFRKTVEALAEQAGPARMPCSRCGDSTLVPMLNQYGARCFACYEKYCTEPQIYPDVGDKRQDGPRAWAKALQKRDEAGERLSAAQRVMWRAVL